MTAITAHVMSISFAIASMISTFDELSSSREWERSLRPQVEVDEAHSANGRAVALVMAQVWENQGSECVAVLLTA
jgi:hypothetical protein